ncbi:MAG: Zn-dependent exopeptidase M28 [Deltaproteobacteria bacterium]|nr:MAG: Zn-dependent exopeptidase M28 [Deltaproteobacteria bacterium]
MLLFLASALALDPTAIRDAVSEDRLLADMRELTGVDPLSDGTRIVSRSVSHPDIAVAEDWLFAAFSAIDGLTVTREPFAHSGPEPVANIVAELPGADPALAPMVVMAHYDSTASLDEGWQATTDPAPGADDDASGIAAILEIARVLASWEPGFARTVRFVGFSAEEVGLVGSTAHVANLDAPVHLALALDPVGHNPGDSDILWFSYDGRWVDEADALEALAEEISELSVTGVDEELFGGDARSDHYPFWQAGMPALHIGTFPLPPSYHTVEDTLAAVDPTFLFEVTVLVAARAAEEAEPLPEEQPGGCACDAVGPASWLVWVIAPLAWRRRRPS